jgi:hypothetical protein
VADDRQKIRLFSSSLEPILPQRFVEKGRRSFQIDTRVSFWVRGAGCTDRDGTVARLVLSGSARYP